MMDSNFYHDNATIILASAATTLSILRLTIDYIIFETIKVNETVYLARKQQYGNDVVAILHETEPEVQTYEKANKKSGENEDETGYYDKLELVEESTPLLRKANLIITSSSSSIITTSANRVTRVLSNQIISVMIHSFCLSYFLTESLIISLSKDKQQQHQPKEQYFIQEGYYSSSANGAHYGIASLLAFALSILCSLIIIFRDWDRRRRYRIQSLLYILSSSIVSLDFICNWKNRNITNSNDFITGVILIIYSIWTISESTVLIFCSNIYQKFPTMNHQPSRRKVLLRMLQPYIWPKSTLNRILIFLTWAFVIAAKTAKLIAPLMLGKATSALMEADLFKCITSIFLYCGLGFLASFFMEGQEILYLKVAQDAFVSLSGISFDHLHQLSLEWHLKKKIGKITRSIDRGIAACDTLMQNLFLYLIPVIIECIMVCVIFIFYFKYFLLGVVAFYFIFSYISITIWLAIKRKSSRQMVNKSDNEWHEIFTESILNFEIVKYFCGEHYERTKFTRAVKKYQRENVNFQISISCLNNCQSLLFQLCLAIMLSLTAYAIINGIMKIGDFVSVSSYTYSLFLPLNSLSRIYNQLMTASIDVEHLSEILMCDPDIVDAPNAISLPSQNVNGNNVAIEFNNVVFNYPTQPISSGLKGISFHIEEGHTLAIVGSTGSGKSTISRLLLRFYDTIQGDIKVNGVNIKSLKQDSLREGFGVVPQTSYLFNDTIKENLLYAKRDATDEELRCALRDSQLLNFIDSLPLGWDTIVGDRGLKLSGGEKQRVAIARCLLKGSPMIILDEASSSLDTLTEKLVQEAIHNLGINRTCIIIAHRLGTICHADKIIVVDHGVVSEEGTHEELIRLNGKYAKMWQMQDRKV